MAKCKKCKGNNAKKLSVIVKQGTSEMDISRQVLFGGRVQSTTKTADDARYKPKSSDTASSVQMGGGCLAIILVPALILAFIFPGIDIESIGGIIFMLFLMLVTGILYAIYNPFNAASNREQEASAKERDEYERSWMCLDCGHKWTDAPSKSIATQKTRLTSQTKKTKISAKKSKKPIKTSKDGELLINSSREVIDYDTDGEDGYPSDEKDVVFRYINCVDIVNKSHVSKGDINTFFIQLGKEYIEYYETYQNIYPKEEIINILQWSLDQLGAIYSTNSTKVTGEKRKQKIQEIINKIQKN